MALLVYALFFQMAGGEAPEFRWVTNSIEVRSSGNDASSATLSSMSLVSVSSKAGSSDLTLIHYKYDSLDGSPSRIEQAERYVVDAKTLESKTQKAQTRYSASGTLQVFRPPDKKLPKGRWDTVFDQERKPAFCKPDPQIEKQTREILNKASNAATDEIRSQLIEDLNWMKTLQLMSKRESADAAIHRFLASLQKKYPDPHSERASRLLAALTVYGEFRGELNDIFQTGVLMSLENRKNSRHAYLRPGISDDFGDLNDWLKDEPGGIALANGQYSCWSDHNLTAILKAPSGGGKSLKEIINFTSEFYSNQISHEGFDTITHYISPLALGIPPWGNNRPPSWYNGKKSDGELTEVDMSKMKVTRNTPSGTRTTRFQDVENEANPMNFKPLAEP